jgi:hypothetical protein
MFGVVINTIQRKVREREREKKKKKKKKKKLTRLKFTKDKNSGKWHIERKVPEIQHKKQRNAAHIIQKQC